MRTSVLDVAGFIHGVLERQPKPRLGGLAQLSIVRRVEALADACGVTVRTGGSVPSYSPLQDLIVTPSVAYYVLTHPWRPLRKYAVGLAHELYHLSGHQNRLGRAQHRAWGDEIYTREELSAELASALVCHRLGICNRTTLYSSTYVNGWLRETATPELELQMALNRAMHGVGYLFAMARSRSSLFAGVRAG